MMGRPLTLDQLRQDVGLMVERITHVTMMLQRSQLRMEEYVCLKVIAMLSQRELFFIHFFNFTLPMRHLNSIRFCFWYLIVQRKVAAASNWKPSKNGTCSAYRAMSNTTIHNRLGDFLISYHVYLRYVQLLFLTSLHFTSLKRQLSTPNFWWAVRLGPIGCYLAAGK